MSTLKLKNFPNVCRTCLQDYPPPQLVSVDSFPQGCFGLSIAECLAEFTPAVEMEYSYLIPTEICVNCLHELENAVAYRKRQTFITQFVLAMAKLRQGYEDAMMNLFSSQMEYVREVLRDLGLCSKADISEEDLLREFTIPKLQHFWEEERYDTPNVSGDDMDDILPMEFVEVHVPRRARPKRALQKPRKYLNDKEALETLSKILPDGSVFEVEMIDDLKHELNDDSDDNDHPPVVQQAQKRKWTQRVPKHQVKGPLQSCPKCSFQSCYAQTFEYHLKTRHQVVDRTSWTCHEKGCEERTFKKRADFINHRKEEHPKNVCDICGESFTTMKGLENHRVRHTGKPTIPCLYCDSMYYIQGDLRNHLRTIHVNPKEFTCEICGLVFKTKKHLRVHVKTHAKARDFECSTCGLKFKTKHHMARHISEVHMEKRYECDHCPQSYGRIEKLRLHLEKTHGIQSYFVCDVCLATFVSQEQLDTHSKRHDNPKPLECEICLIAFLKQTDLDDHLCITYQDHYVCCERDWKCHQLYNKHKLLVHDIKINARVKPITGKLLGQVRAERKQAIRCPKCEAEFTTRTLKNAHLPYCSGKSLYSKKHLTVSLKDIGEQYFEQNRSSADSSANEL